MEDAAHKASMIQPREKYIGSLILAPTLCVFVACSKANDERAESVGKPDASSATDASKWDDSSTPLRDGAAGSIEAGKDDGSSDAGFTVLGHPDSSKQYPKYEGFSLYLVEEFTEPLDLDLDPIWTWGDGAISNSQTRFVKENISFVEGKMLLSVTQEHAPGNYSHSRNGMAPGRDLKSAEVRTRFNMFRWGRYEVALRAPDIDGNFILSMFTFRTPGHQQWREIDFEALANLPESINTNVIMGDQPMSWSADLEEPATIYPLGGGQTQGLPLGYENRQSFHVYAFELLPDKVTWFVDDVPIRIKEAGVGENELPVPELSMKIMFNLWVFVRAGFGGDPIGNTYPFTGEYDWFRFYKWDGDDRYPCAPVPACLAADDLDLSGNNPNEDLAN
jgi:beta-glucanase (GH16 family)